MHAAGIEPEPGWLVETAPKRLDAAVRTASLFTSKHAPTAAVCYNDAVALGLMLGLAARGRRAGVDFALTGFDDIPEAAVSAPPLTTIAVAPRERGMQAARLVLERLADAEGAARAPRAIVADARLVVRASSLVAPHAVQGTAA